MPSSSVSSGNLIGERGLKRRLLSLPAVPPCAAWPIPTGEVHNLIWHVKKAEGSAR